MNENGWYIMDNNINKMIRDYYLEVRNILIKKRDLLDQLACELNNKKILFQDEIRCLINSWEGQIWNLLG